MLLPLKSYFVGFFFFFPDFSDGFLCPSEPKYLEFKVFAHYSFWVGINQADQHLIIIKLILMQLHRIN